MTYERALKIGILVAGFSLVYLAGGWGCIWFLVAALADGVSARLKQTDSFEEFKTRITRLENRK